MNGSDRSPHAEEPVVAEQLLTHSRIRAADFAPQATPDSSTEQTLDVFFHPRSIAVIGATERAKSPGRQIFENLQTHFHGPLYAVNNRATTVLGSSAYAALEGIPGSVDLAIIVTPAASVPDIITQCIEAGARGAIVISSGFREHGVEGRALEREIQQRLVGTSFRVIGPNCLGVMNPLIRLNATFATKQALPGNVAFISQSGALCTSILDWSLKEIMGFSAFVSVGSMLDVGWGDLIDYFGTDPNTESIVMYMESVGESRKATRKLIAAAQRVAPKKPIIVIKAGRTQASSKAVASHTGALMGSDDVLDAAFKRIGILRVDSVSDLFHMADVLAKQPRAKGKRLTIVTNAGGPGVLAADALLLGGGELGDLSKRTLDKLDRILPPHWSHGNPIDTLADTSEETFERALELAVSDEGTDAILAITAPLVAARPITLAHSITKYAHFGKPVLASFMGASAVEEADEIMSYGGVPTFRFPDQAARVFNYMWRYAASVEALLERVIDEPEDRETLKAASAIIDRVLQDGRTLLTEIESKELLATYGIPVNRTRAGRSAEAAVDRAEEIGYPVVVKLLSRTITHKSDVGGVMLDLQNADEVRAAFRRIQDAVVNRFGEDAFDGVTVQPMVRRQGFELIVGSTVDTQFGPVLLFGAGGVLVEVLKDRAFGFPPMNKALARRMMETTRVWQLLKGVRGMAAVDVSRLEDLMVSFSALVAHHPRIAEIDINPLLATPDMLCALDARVMLHPASIPDHELPRTVLVA